MSDVATHSTGPRAASLPASTVRRLNDAIEALIGLLDALSPDCDLEEDDPCGGDIGDEPQMDAAEGSGLPCMSDVEPSLGATNDANQEHAWLAPADGYDDCELNDDDEPFESGRMFRPDEDVRMPDGTRIMGYVR